MAELKTRPTAASVEDYLAAIDDETRREDCRTLVRIMRRATGEEPRMWGPGIVGFGSYHYRYASGREGDWFVTGFASRKRELTLYIMSGFSRYGELMAKLGRHKTGKACLYVKRLSDVDVEVLRQLVTESVRQARSRDAAAPS